MKLDSVGSLKGFLGDLGENKVWLDAYMLALARLSLDQLLTRRFCNLPE